MLIHGTIATVAEAEAGSACETPKPVTKAMKAMLAAAAEAAKSRFMIVYTDGGCKPSRGIGGWGMHGYIYTNDAPKQGSGCDWLPTNLGYVESLDAIRAAGRDSKIPDTNVSSEGISPVSLIEYVDGYGSLIPESTNNEAEMTAMYNALKVAKDRGVSGVHVMADSEYTIKGVTEWCDQWARTDWKRKDGTAIANVPLWKKIKALRDELKAAGVQLQVSWVRGHSGNFGNDLVDAYASASIIAGRKGVQIEKLTVGDAKGYWSSKSDYNRMFSLPYWYFNTNSGGRLTSPDGRAVYHIGDHGNEDDFLGKPISDTGFGVLFLKEEEPVLEALRGYQDQIDKGGFNSVVVGRLTPIFAAKQYTDITSNGTLFLQQANWGKLDVYTAADLLLTKELRPPRIAFRMAEALSKLENVLVDYVAKPPESLLTVTDITDLLYEESTDKKKPVTKLLSTITSATKKFVVSAAYNTGKSSGVFKLPIAMGLDIVNRNTLSAIAALNPKVKLVTWRESDVSFRYATVIETDVDAGIWASIYSNICLIPS